MHPCFRRSFAALFAAFLSASLATTHAQGQDASPIARLLPPAGIELVGDARAGLEAALNKTDAQLDSVQHDLRPDAEVFSKAVRFALANGEFYKPEHTKLAKRLLITAAERGEQLRPGKHPWTTERGLVVRGYRSTVDGAALPYGLEIPDKLDLTKPAPLYVWLHGRSANGTDMHFIAERLARRGKIKVDDAIVLHPFGRQCIGYKSAGEIDVLEAIEHVKSQYNIDDRRIVLMGFSMGGAGVWHLGAHYADRWVAMSPGAGFAETAHYNKIARANYPPWYEQRLWGLYDVPCYTRNLFNLPVVAYSGEKDKQIQAARVMETAFKSEGESLVHLIGPGMGHAYHPQTLADLLKRMKTARDRGLDLSPKNVSLQTRTLRYSKMFWVQALGLEQHWRDSRVDAVKSDSGEIVVATKNITSLALSPRPNMADTTIRIDGQVVKIPAGDKLPRAVLAKRNGQWKLVEKHSVAGLAKVPGLQGPIDDCFLEPFLVVRPTGKFANKKVAGWVEFELAHFEKRWRELFRGEVRIKNDRDVTAEDIERYHLVLWGDPSSNRVLARCAGKLPIRWSAKEVQVGEHSFSAADHVPLAIYPNPLAPHKYVVLNSGPTFRERHDRTNSLQNPKLPDWAILNLSQPPDGERAGKVVAADFFDERWHVRDAKRD